MKKNMRIKLIPSENGQYRVRAIWWENGEKMRKQFTAEDLDTSPENLPYIDYTSKVKQILGIRRK